MNFKKILFVDTETTGLNEYKCEPHQIAMLIEINGKIVEERVFYTQPINWANVDQKALTISGVTMEDLKNYPKPIDTFLQVSQLLSKHVSKFDKSDKFICSGQNVQFDMNMLNQWFKKMGDSYFYSYVESKIKLDILPITCWFSYLKKLPDMENSKLETVCNALGIELYAHDALNDIKASRQVFLRYKEMMQ